MLLVVTPMDVCQYSPSNGAAHWFHRAVGAQRGGSMLVDEKYYEVAKSGSIAERAMIIARDQIFEDFLARMRPSPENTILDIGVSDVLSEGANVLERRYQHRHNITACGLGECREFQRKFPSITYRKIKAKARLPFADGAFDIATSNAVLEHLGNPEDQKTFLWELARVSQRAFISVPNRFFPIEHHTAIPLLHFTDQGFKIACSVLGKRSWVEQQNLILLTRKRLWRLAEGLKKSIAVGYTGLRMGPLSSNLYIALH